jgi:hypothetical protein
VQLVLHLGDVVVQAVGGGQLVGLLELGQGGLEAPLVKQLHPAREALARLFHGGLVVVRQRGGGQGHRERRADDEEREETGSEEATGGGDRHR